MIQRLRNRRERGFTLIELLIVVAIIGIIAAILIPNLIDAIQKAKQKRTVSDERTMGTALMAWVTDQASAAAAGQGQTPQYDISAVDTVTYQQVLAILRPSSTFFYLQEVPQQDGWGGLYDFHIISQGNNRQALFRGGSVVAIRSFGRDGAEGPQTNPYPIGAFVATDYDQDIVWADGFLVHYPGGLSGLQQGGGNP